VIIAHCIALNPNNNQATYLSKAAGTARFAYNWALAKWDEQYKLWQEDNSRTKPSQYSLRRELNAIKHERFPWMLEVTKNAPQMAIIQLGKAFSNFFAKRAKYPKFRKKGIHDRFSITNDQLQLDGARIRIPRLGWIRMREELRFNGKVMSATISRRADKWYVSISVEVQNLDLPKAENQGAVGVDLGISTLATLSNGEKIAGVKAHKALLVRLKRLSRSLSRKLKGSNNRNKAKMKLSKLHAKIADIRSDALHKLTSDLTSRFHTIGIENLNVKGMLKNRRLSRSISDMSFFEFRRQLEYKADMRGGQIVVADRFFASSKTCSFCGNKLEKLPLSIRQWQCNCCHVVHDRDINAAINLRNIAVSSTVLVCGEKGSDLDCKIKVKPVSMKQKVNSKSI